MIKSYSSSSLKVLLVLAMISIGVSFEAVAQSQNVGIGTTSPNASAILDLDVSSPSFATKLGFLVPRITLAQRTAIASPATSLLVYQTDAVAGFYFYNGSSWIRIIDATTNDLYLLLAGGTMSGNISMGNNLIENIGAAGTDFLAGGGLNLANTLTVASGGINVTGASTITGALTGLTGLTSSGSITFSGLAANSIVKTGVGGLLSTGNVNLTSEVTGILPIANGGTGSSSVPTNGQLLIGNGSNYTLANITPGSNISVTNAAGSITISATGLQASLSFDAPLVNNANTISIPVANGSTDGYLSSANWTTFNNKIGTGTAAGGELSGTYPNPTIADGIIDNANISATAEIDVTKLANSGTDNQIIRTNGTAVEWWTPTYLTSETVGTGTTAGGELSGTYPNPTIADGIIDNANISATAEIDVTKLANSGTDNQIIRTNGTAVEWWTPSYLTTETVGTGTAAGGELSGTYPNPTIADGIIDNANISATAEIDVTKLANSGTDNQIIRTNGTAVEWWTPTYLTSETVGTGTAAGGDLSGTYPNPTIADGIIDNANISATAEIDVTKLANSGTDNQIIRTNGTAVEWWTPTYLTSETVGTGTAAGGDLSGTYPNPTIANSAVTNAKIADNAVDGSKIELTGNVAGDIMYYDGSNWLRLAVGTNNQVLKSNGTVPIWGSSGTLPSASNKQTVYYNGTDWIATSNLNNDGTNVGLGTLSSAATLLHQDAGDATATYHKFSAGSTTGQGLTDGFDLGVDGSGNALINQRENLDLLLYTNSTERFKIFGNGDIAMGTSTSISPDSINVQVNGDMRITGDLVVDGNIDPVALILQPLNAEPGTFTEGMLYYDNVSKDIKIRKAGGWDNIVAATIAYDMPASDGTNGQVLSTNGSGQLSWTTASGSLPAGTSGQTLRYNAGNALEATSNLYNNGTNIGINNPSPLVSMDINGGLALKSASGSGAIDVGNRSYIKVSGSLSLTGGLSEGQILILQATASTSLSSGGNVRLDGSGIWNPSNAGATLSLIWDGAQWVETARTL